MLEPKPQPPTPAPTQDNEATTARPLPGRVLSLDLGSRTIGLAVSDPLGLTAQGLDTIRRNGRRNDFDALNDVVRKFEVKQMVIGWPLHMSGDEGRQSQKAAAFAAELREHFRLPVHLWDERLTTAEAQRVLRSSDMSIQRRGMVIDRLAAVLILQSWLDARPPRAE